MNLIQRIRTRCYKFYPDIMLFLLNMMVQFTGYLSYELIVNKNNLIYWKHVTKVDTHVLDYNSLMLLMIFSCGNLLLSSIFILVYLSPLSNSPYNDLTLLQIKDRYVRFIMLRLIARLDKIQLILNNKQSMASIDFMTMMRTNMRAYDSMVKAVELFRKDVRKVLSPSEAAIMLPIEDVFCVPEAEERALKRDGYYNLPIEYSDDNLKSLLNPKEAE